MRVISLMLLILPMVACGGGGMTTPYRPEGWMGGFSSTQVDRNEFIVIFTGNQYTNKLKANDFALLRSAEIALENGYSYFVIIDDSVSDALRSSIAELGPGDTETRVQKRIICFDTKPEGASYNAEFIARRISTKYGIRLHRREAPSK